MKRLLNSYLVALLLLLIVVAGLVASFQLRTAWWAFTDVFFAFMMAFTHLMALMVRSMKMEKAYTLLERIALACGGLFIVAFITEYFLLNT